MEGKLIIEIYEYSSDSSSMPVFEYIPCDLSKCLKGKSAALKDIIRRGFDDVPRKTQDADKRQEDLMGLFYFGGYGGDIWTIRNFVSM